MGRKAYLASIVPVIVNAVLNDHQIVVDIVAFVNKGDFPRSRLGEKQRGKILASWVTRKMRTMAQFGIRDADSAMSDIIETIEPRRSGTNLKNGSVIASSLRNAESAPQILEEGDFDRQQYPDTDFIQLPTGISEMPAMKFDDPVDELFIATGTGASTMSDKTPTDDHKMHFELDSHDETIQQNDSKKSFEVPGFGKNERRPETPPPPVGPKPLSPLSSPSQIRNILPAVEGREGDLWSLPSQQPRSAGLRVQNASSDDDDNEEDQWKRDAVMHMNLAGN